MQDYEKNRLFIAFASIVMAMASLQILEGKIAENNDSSVAQVGAGAIYASYASNWEGGDKATAATVGGIVSGVRVSMIKTSVPASMTPLGWYGVAAGLIL